MAPLKKGMLGHGDGEKGYYIKLANCLVAGLV